MQRLCLRSPIPMLLVTTSPVWEGRIRGSNNTIGATDWFWSEKNWRTVVFNADLEVDFRVYEISPEKFASILCGFVVELSDRSWDDTAMPRVGSRSWYWTTNLCHLVAIFDTKEACLSHNGICLDFPGIYCSLVVWWYLDRAWYNPYVS